MSMRNVILMAEHRNEDKMRWKFLKRPLKRILLGAPRSLHDPGVFHRISLVAFLAWVGLGADGLSSSAYGPDEAFRALGEHTYLAVGLALATTFTVFIISYAYSRIVEHFPFGGGGYVVASRLLGPNFGVVSGSALLVDYVLTISVSIASGADQVFSVLPPSAAHYKLGLEIAAIGLMMVMNLRGVKESVTILAPIFFAFLITHAILILGGIATHAFETTRVVNEVRGGFGTGLATLGLAGMFGLFIHAYTMGAGTYTGIEAVSNGLQIMREPKVETGKRTMFYMAISLAVTASGMLVCYLLFHVRPVEGKTMNAVLLERFAGGWSLGGIPVGHLFVVFSLAAEAALLFVAAQAGFIDGPRVMANMAHDSWMPHRFNSLSDRLTMQNGVVLISGAAIMTLIYTLGETRTLVLMYSINVFLTFSLSESGMVRYWIRERKKYPDWWHHITIHIVGLILCLSILIVNVYEKFREGGWVTLAITALLIALCFLIKRHYRKVTGYLSRLDEILTALPTNPDREPLKLDPKAPTAVLLVGSYAGLGIHALLTIQRLFPNHFKNVIFLSVGVVDAATMKGVEEVDRMREQTEESLRHYVGLSRSLRLAADYRMSVGTEVLVEAERLCKEVAGEFPNVIFFAGKLVFQKEGMIQRLLHNETAYELQSRLQFDGLNAMVLPVRVFDVPKVGVLDVTQVA